MRSHSNLCRPSLTHRPDEEPLSREIVEQAAQWHTRMQSKGVTECELAAFSAWQQQSPKHEKAFQRIHALWGDIDSGDSHRTRDTVKSALASQKKHHSKRKRKVVVAGAALGSMLIFFIFQPFIDNPALTGSVLSGHLFADYRTGVGERKEVVLSDNSRLRLNTFSSVDVEFTPTRRTIYLRQGEIQINVAEDNARPLVVRAPQGSATALGTEFSVHNRGDSLKVDVSESSVDVCAIAKGTESSQCQRLQEGETIIVNNGRVHLPQPTDSSFVHDWSRHVIIVSEQPVLDVLDELSRHHKGVVVIDRSQLSDHKVSGVFDLSDFARSLQAIEASVSLSVRRFTPWYTFIGV